MTFKPAVWRPIAIGLSAVNLIAVGFVTGPGEQWHTAIHAALALAFGLWAQRMRPASAPEGSDRLERLEVLEVEMGDVRRELSEAQERLDFTERVLAQRSEARDLSP